MEQIVTIFIALICTLLFLDIKSGISAYIVYSFLVPVDPRFFVMSSSNMIQLCMLASILIYSLNHKSKERFGYVIKPFAPLIILYFLYLLFSLFGSEVPFGSGFLKWQLHIRRYFFLPIVMWYVFLIDKKAINWFNNAFIISGVLILVYGVFLLFTDGFNPYVFFVSSTYNVSERANAMNESNSFRYMYRISSFFLHPMSYGLYLCLLSVFLYSIRDKLRKHLFIVLMLLCVVCILMSGVRTSMASFFFGILVYLLFLRKFQISLLFLFLGIIGYFIISFIPEINGTIESIYNSDKEISGSSIDVRIEQFDGCIKEIMSCFTFGKGYDWTQFYMEKFGNHPSMLAFESVIIKVLCDFGIAGLISYIICYYQFIRKTIRMVSTRDSKALVVTLVAVFVFYCVATGDYDYLSLFLPFYSIYIINQNQSTKVIEA